MPFVFDQNNDCNILNDENILITDLSLDIPQQFCTRGVKAKDGEQLRCTLSGKKKKKAIFASNYTPSDHASIVASKFVQVEKYVFQCQSYLALLMKMGEFACLEMVGACAKSYYMYKVNSAS